ncbi:MAG: hypothetical protein QNJ11_04430 [Woeseiaceae bacterium]|nr:hypothetical protein [Woeseiaceae bacterium]
MTVQDRRLRTDNVFFPALAVLISAVGLSGFWFTYFAPIIDKTYPPAGFPLHLHGWSFFLWLILFPVQAVLIGRKHFVLHSRMGKLSAFLVLVMTLTGLLVLSVRAEEAARDGEPLVWLLYGPLFLSNLFLFVVFYSASVYMALTKRLQAHKRLIIVASGIGVAAGLSRWIMIVTGFHPLSIPIGVLSCSVFLLVGLAYDIVTRRLVHPAYLVGLATFIFVMVPLLPQVSESNVAWVNQWLAALGEHIGFLYDPEPTVEFDHP